MLADRLDSSMTATFDLLAVYVGERLGWDSALADGPRTASELAAATGTNERYAREWLEPQAPLARFAVSLPRPRRARSAAPRS